MATTNRDAALQDSYAWLYSVLDNGSEVRRALRSGIRDAIPPLRLRSGMVVHHAPEDPVEYVLRETFFEEAYTGDGFFRPHATSTVMDCGANIGMFALLISAAAPGVRVHCFEPARSTRSRLHTNIEANGLTDFVRVHPFALSNANGFKVLESGRSSAEASLYPGNRKSRPGSRRDAWIPGEIVECVDLQSAVQLCNAGEIDLLKLDIEGAEADVLEHAGPALQRVRRICLEYHNILQPGCFERVIRVLTRAGFEITTMFSDLGMRGGIGIVRATRV